MVGRRWLQRLEFGGYLGTCTLRSNSKGLWWLEYVIILIDALLASLASSAKHLDLAIIAQAVAGPPPIPITTTPTVCLTQAPASPILPSISIPSQASARGNAKGNEPNRRRHLKAKPYVLLARLSPRQKKRGIVLYTVINQPAEEEKGVNNQPLGSRLDMVSRRPRFAKAAFLASICHAIPAMPNSSTVRPVPSRMPV